MVVLVKKVIKIIRDPSRSTWALGRLYDCEKLSSAHDVSEALASWTEGNFTWVIRKAEVPRESSTLVTLPEYYDNYSIKILREKPWDVWEGFKLGNNAMCKISQPRHRRETDLDRQNIDYVRAHFPEIRIPKPIFDWYDEEENLYFLIYESYDGVSVEHARGLLSEGRVDEVVNYVAGIVRTLATQRSSLMSSITGKPINDEWMDRNSSLIGPMDHKQCYERFGPVMSPYEHGNQFVLYHPHLTPRNIALTGPNEKPVIISWEGLAFYPRFWEATRPDVCPLFHYSGRCDDGRFEWKRKLLTLLRRLGFSSVKETYLRTCLPACSSDSEMTDSDWE